MNRKIIHIDCDCYYAALEMRDFPALRERAVAVGGTGPRSVLSTCNYAARAFGVRSAMPVRKALALCPDLVIQPHRFDVYRQVSQQIRAIFLRYTDTIEPLSLDEAYLDVSDTNWFAGSATMLAEHIRQEVFQSVGITVSAGVAPNKFLAKICSDWNKPNGLFVVAPAQVTRFLAQLPVRKINGVGAKFNERLAQQGIQSCADVLAWPLPKLIQQFGKSGFWLHQRARGIDERLVGGRRQAKSVSTEHTFTADVSREQAIKNHLAKLYDALEQRLLKRPHPSIKAIFIKVRFSDFTTTTMERACPLTLENIQRLFTAAAQRSPLGIRLLGLGVRFKDSESAAQLDLWPDSRPKPLPTP